MIRKKSRQSIDAKIAAAIHKRGHGSVFVPTDFLDIGSRTSVGVALHRLARQGMIRHLARAYMTTRKSTPNSVLLHHPPSQSPARWLVEIAGAYAANALGLSEQVPSRAVFLTDGPARTVEIGPTTIQLRRTTPKNMEAANRLSGLLIQALRELGEQHITRERRDHLKRTLPANKRRELLKDLRLAPAWMHPIFRELAGEQA